MHLFGIIIVDKPEGLTSFDVVARARRRFRTRSIGHTGTLDPMATGVLPLCVAESTRIARFLCSDDKEYEAELKLGQATDSLDRMGKITAEAPVPGSLTDEMIEGVLKKFRGSIQQIPPMFSAIHVNGERLYEKARRGETVEREPRDVEVFSLEMTSRPAPDRIRIRVSCSKGTYIRTLGSDIGEALGCHAHLTMLRRTRAGNFSIEDAVRLDEMMSMSDEALASKMLGERRALSSMREFIVGEETERQIRNGLKLPAAAIPGFGDLPQNVPAKIVSGADGALVAVAELSLQNIHYLRGLPRIDPGI